MAITIVIVHEYLIELRVRNKERNGNLPTQLIISLTLVKSTLRIKYSFLKDIFRYCGKKYLPIKRRNDNVF